MPLDTLADVSPCTAVTNLGALHRIPDTAAVYATRRDGHLVLHVAVEEQTAEAWRAAFGAPAYTPEPQLNYTRHRTSVLWMGAEVRLTYPTP